MNKKNKIHNKSSLFWIENKQAEGTLASCVDAAYMTALPYKVRQNGQRSFAFVRVIRLLARLLRTCLRLFLKLHRPTC